MSKQSLMLALAIGLLAVASVVLYKQLFPPPDPYAQARNGITFKDAAPSNALDIFTPQQLELAFVNAQGNSVSLRDICREKPVVLVMTRGFHLVRCPYCTAQTSRLINNYDKFKERGAEVLVVYPGPTANLPEFLAAVKEQANDQVVPFPLLYDQDLKAVDQLGIRYQLAKPSTLIFDREGNLRYAYVGKDLSDRPSVKAMLDQLDQFTKEAQPASP